MLLAAEEGGGAAQFTGRLASVGSGAHHVRAAVLGPQPVVSGPTARTVTGSTVSPAAAPTSRHRSARDPSSSRTPAGAPGTRRSAPAHGEVAGPGLRTSR